MKLPFVVAVALISVGLVGLFAWYAGTSNPSGDATVASTDLEKLVGKPAPDFTLENLDGETVPLGSLKGKKVVMFFNEGIMCYPACWNQIAALGADSALNNDEVATLSIVPDSREEWQEAVEKMPELGQATILLDADLTASRAYDVLDLPSSMHRGGMPGHTYVVLDQNGIVRYTFDDPNMGIQNDRIKDELTKI